MRLALRLARRGCGLSSPNPMVGAALVKGDKIIGCGWHRRAGLPHAEVEALRDAQKRGHNPHGSTLYVTLEPCCTHGRTPPCTDAIIEAGVKRVVVGTKDPNPRHAGTGLGLLKKAGIEVMLLAEPGSGVERELRAHRGGQRRARPTQYLAEECAQLNEAFNHWIVHRTPFVTVKAAMTLDGKIATSSGESKWITGEKARAYGMRFRQSSDAILVGINTILADDPSLTIRKRKAQRAHWETKQLRRIILDSMARTPLEVKVLCDKYAALTTIVVSKHAPNKRVAAMAKHVNVLVAPIAKRRQRSGAPRQIDLRCLLKKLGSENVTSLLVEGGGEVNASFLEQGLAQRLAFFYAPRILGGRDSRKAVAGEGVQRLGDVIQLRELEWRKLGPDLFLTARVASKS